MATKFFKCKHSGNVVLQSVDNDIQLAGCSENLEELIPNTVDASQEKHVPVVTRIDDNTIRVDVGSVEHPMAEEHHIAFIYVETENGGILANLKDKPTATFNVSNDRPVAVYEYCNLHGLWKVDL